MQYQLIHKGIQKFASLEDLKNNIPENYILVLKKKVTINDKTIYSYVCVAPEEREMIILNFRRQREKECFPIINRGQLWYENLTTQQYNEIQIWYKAWLDVTETLIPPTKPIWLK